MSPIVPVPAPQQTSFAGWLVPSLLDVFFGALLLSAFAHPQGLRSLLSDGDTGWHIRAGELVLETGTRAGGGSIFLQPAAASRGSPGNGSPTSYSPRSGDGADSRRSLRWPA